MNRINADMIIGAGDGNLVAMSDEVLAREKGES